MYSLLSLNFGRKFTNLDFIFRTVHTPRKGKKCIWFQTFTWKRKKRKDSFHRPLQFMLLISGAVKHEYLSGSGGKGYRSVRTIPSTELKLEWTTSQLHELQFCSKAMESYFESIVLCYGKKSILACIERTIACKTYGLLSTAQILFGKMFSSFKIMLQKKSTPATQTAAVWSEIKTLWSKKDNISKLLDWFTEHKWHHRVRLMMLPASTVLAHSIFHVRDIWRLWNR